MTDKEKSTKAYHPVQADMNGGWQNADNFLQSGQPVGNMNRYSVGSQNFPNTSKDGAVVSMSYNGTSKHGYQIAVDSDGRLHARHKSANNTAWTTAATGKDITDKVNAEISKVKSESDNKYLNRNAIALQTHQSIDDILETGVYRTTEITLGTFPKDLHTERLGMLVALKHSQDQSTQILYSLFNNKNYMRVKKAGSAWSDWSTQLDQDLSKVFKTPSGKILTDANNLKDNGYVITDNNTANLPNISSDGKHGIIKFVKTSNPTTRNKVSGVQYFTSGKGAEAGTMYTRVKRDGVFDKQWKTMGADSKIVDSYKYDNGSVHQGSANTWVTPGSIKTEKGRTSDIPAVNGNYGVLFYVPESGNKGAQMWFGLEPDDGLWVRNSGAGGFADKGWKRVSTEDRVILKPEVLAEKNSGSIDDLPSGIIKVGGAIINPPASGTHAMLETYRHRTGGNERGYQIWTGIEGNNGGKRFIRYKRLAGWQPWVELPTINNSMIYQGDVPTANDCNNWFTAGVCKTSNTTLNTPISGSYGNLLFLKDSDSSGSQIWTDLTESSKVFVRSKSSRGNWGGWKEIGADSFLGKPQPIPQNDADIKHPNGIYITTNNTAHMPFNGSNVGNYGILRNFYQNFGNDSRVQLYTPIDGADANKVFIRTRLNGRWKTGSGTHLNEWQLVTDDSIQKPEVRGATDNIDDYTKPSGIYQTNHNNTAGTYPEVNGATVSNKTGVLQYYKIGATTGVQFWSTSVGNGQQKLFMRSVDAGNATPWVEIGQAQPIPVPPQPGGGGRPIIRIPQDNQPNLTTGEYAVNFFNYRDITENTLLRVNGDKFINRRPDTNHNAFGSVNKYYDRNVRIRKNDYLFFKYRVIKTTQTSPHNKVVFNILPKDGHGDKLKLEYDVVHDELLKWNTKPYDGHSHGAGNVPNAYSYACFELGSDNGGYSESTMQVRGWYGDFEPKGLTQSFEFKKFNNVKLLAMANFSAIDARNDALRDEYRVYKRKTTLKRKVGILKLKDVKEWHYDETGRFILIPIPDDCKDVNPILMSNNLCDISANDAGAPGVQENPFFVRSLGTAQNTPFKDIVYNTPGDPSSGMKLDENGRPIQTKVNKQCFQILLSKEYFSYWRYLLEKTEILYELKPQAEEQLPVGGQIYVMNDGSRIRTCLYKTVQAGTGTPESNKYMIEFKDSPFGEPDISIMMHNIVEVIDNSGWKQVFP